MKIDMTKHIAIVGETQSGKTLLANYLYQNTGGLFIDIEDLGDIEGDVSFNMGSSAERFREALKRYKRIRYVPLPDIYKSINEIAWIWKELKKLNKNIYLYVDELQNWGEARKNVFDVFAIRGLKYGIHLVSITQRPKNISKTIATQTTTFVFFDIGEFERLYFMNYKLPYDEIKERLKDAPQYSFLIYHRGIGLSIPYKLKI